MFYAAIVRWSAFILLSPLRLISVEAHEKAYRSTMTAVSVLGLALLVLIVIAAITGAGSSPSVACYWDGNSQTFYGPDC